MEELGCYFRARRRTALWLAVSPASVYGEGKLDMTHKRSSTDQYLRVFFHTVGCSHVQIEENPEHILDILDLRTPPRLWPSRSLARKRQKSSKKPSSPSCHLGSIYRGKFIRATYSSDEFRAPVLQCTSVHYSYSVLE